MNKKLTPTLLGKVLQIKHGYPFLGEYFSDEGELVVLTPGNFYEGGGFKRVYGKEKYYLGDYPEEYLCSKGDLVVAMTQQAEGLLGSTAIIPENGVYLHNQRIGLISYDEKQTDKMFLYYLFMTSSVRQQIRATASGSKVKHTSPERIYDVRVWLPNLPQQKLIGKILNNFDRKISLNNAINAELEKVAKLLYDYWFVQFDFPSAEGKPYRAGGGKMVYNEQLKRKIPKGWKVENFANIASITTGKEDANFSTPNGNYKFFTCSKEPLRCDIPAFNGQAVLIAGNGDFNVKHYSGEFNAYQRTYVIQPNNPLYYSAMYIASNDVADILKKGSYGSIVKFITLGDVQNIKLLISDNPIVYIQLNKIYQEIELLEKENEHLTALRNFLLPLLMNGQVTVAASEN